MRRFPRSLPRSSAVAVVLACGGAFANDSMVRIDAGGLELIKNDSIQMVSEDLHVSRGEIQVDYVFANRTREPVAATIGFPLPATNRALETVFDEQSYDLDNPIGDFVTLIDGKQVASDRRMIIKTEDGHDITALLEATGLLPPTTYAEPWEYRPADEMQWAVLDAAAARAGISSVRGEWEYQLIYVWNLEISAGESINVHHRYHPWIGGYGLYNTGDTPELQDRRRHLAEAYCLGDEAASTLVDDVGADGLVGYVSEVGYILQTGANWAGPIGRFRLTVAAPDDGSSMMTCWPHGSRELVQSPIVFEATDFTPTQDLLIGYFGKPERQAVVD